jgi:GNAT superfamily N-acetyltransferase
VGYDYQGFANYYGSLESLHDFYKTLSLDDVIYGEVGPTLDAILKQNSSHLIIWKCDNEIIGHAVWHETSTDEYRVGDPRDSEECDLLRDLYGGRNDKIVELHELWLRPVNRGKGYGQEFFEFFEQYIRDQGFQGILYYTDNPSAVHICRKREYKEAFLANSQWHIFTLSFDL